MKILFFEPIMTNLTIEHSPYDPIFQLQNLKYSTASFLICMPQELRLANHLLEIVISSIYISPYWSPHHPQKSHWQESGLEMEHYLRIYCFHRSSLPLDGVTMNVSWRNRIGTYSHYLCSIALTSSSSLEAEYRIRSERNKTRNKV